MIKIDFEFDAGVYGTFRDAINLPEDHTFSDAEIEAMKQARFDSWISILNTPPTSEPDPAPQTEGA